jgi:hypothetical protein
VLAYVESSGEGAATWTSSLPSFLVKSQLPSYNSRVKKLRCERAVGILVKLRTCDRACVGLLLPDCCCSLAWSAKEAVEANRFLRTEHMWSTVVFGAKKIVVQ